MPTLTCKSSIPDECFEDIECKIIEALIITGQVIVEVKHKLQDNRFSKRRYLARWIGPNKCACGEVFEKERLKQEDKKDGKETDLSSKST